MNGKGIAKTLRWFLFVIGIGALVASGIYLRTVVAESGATWRILRALMFLLLGTFFMLMYGENRSGPGSDEAEERTKTDEG